MSIKAVYFFNSINFHNLTLNYRNEHNSVMLISVILTLQKWA